MTNNIPSYKTRLHRFCNKVQEMVAQISDEPEVQLGYIQHKKEQQSISESVSEMLVESGDMEDWTHS